MIQISPQVSVPDVPAGSSHGRLSDLRPVGDVDDLDMTAKEDLKNSDTMSGEFLLLILLDF